MWNSFYFFLLEESGIGSTKKIPYISKEETNCEKQSITLQNEDQKGTDRIAFIENQFKFWKQSVDIVCNQLDDSMMLLENWK